jgi:VWFA-related protein
MTSRNRIRLGCALLGVVLFSSQTSSQNPPPAQSPPQQRPPVFRAGANFVLVDAYPQRDGLLVEGLTAADFEVREDGRPQQIESFEFVRIEPSMSEAQRRDPNTQREAEQLAADPHNRVFVVYLDTLHTTVEGSHRIRGPLVDALNRIVAPNDLFGVMTPNIDPRHIVLGRRLISVEEQLTRYWSWGERNSITTDPQDPVEQTLYQCFACKPSANGCVDWEYNDGARRRLMHEVLIDRRREDRTLTSVEKLIDHLAGLREARTVVLAVTDGWLLYREDRTLANEAGVLPAPGPGVTISQGGRIGIADLRSPMATVDRASCNSELARLAFLDNERRFRDLLRNANRANVSFYPVTAAGLGVVDRPITENPRRNPNAPPGVTPFTESMARVGERVDTLRTLAENTDGIAIVNTNDLSAGLKRIVDDVSAYYLLGYYSTNTKFDGRIRNIQVRMKAPGLSVRARRSYVAPSEAALRAEAAPARAAAATAAIDDALGVLARLRPGSELFAVGVEEPDAVFVSVELPGALAATEAWSRGADVQVTVTGPGGESVAAAEGRIEANTRGAVVRVPLAAPPAGPLRVTARVRSGTASLEGPADLRPSSGKLIGDPLLFRSSPAAAAPLRAVADYQYRRTERVHVEWRALATLERRGARLLGRNGQPLAVPVTVTERRSHGRSVVAATLNLAPLSDGDYVIEMTAASGGSTETKWIAIRVAR